MRCLFSSFVIVLAIISSGAQTIPTCKAGAASTIDDRDGVTVSVISFQGPFGPQTAHVFVPDTAEPVAGIAFSHSSIQYADSLTDLLPFARAMARAGAASIMIDGTIDWRTPNDDSKRPWEEVSCAAQWLTANANLDRQRLALGGPITEGGDPFCPLLGEDLRWAVLVRPEFWFEDASAWDLRNRAHEDAPRAAQVDRATWGLSSKASQAGVVGGGCAANICAQTLNSEWGADLWDSTFALHVKSRAASIDFQP